MGDDEMVNFTMIENDIMDKHISDGAFRLYSILKSYCFGNKTTCFPSQETLGKRMRKSVRTIQRYLNELIDASLIKKTRRGSISNEYELIRKSMENRVAKLKEACMNDSGEDKVAKTSQTSYTRKSSKNSFSLLYSLISPISFAVKVDLFFLPILKSVKICC